MSSTTLPTIINCLLILLLLANFIMQLHTLSLKEGPSDRPGTKIRYASSNFPPGTKPNHFPSRAVALVPLTPIVSSNEEDTENLTLSDWEYWGPHGEHHWEKSFKSCKGSSQSPINILRERIEYLPELQLSFINYHRPLNQMELSNNGHTVKLEPSPLTSKRYQCFTTGSALFGETYRFLQLHFHWRNAHLGGSEHAIDGEKFSMEMHIVHQNVKYDKESDTEFVLQNADAFTVIAVFFNETNIHNPALDPIIDHLDSVASAHQSTIINESLRLDSLMPPHETWDRFYRYSGSYTTPGCQEVVTWVIFPTALDIDALQMQKFRELIYRVTHHEGRKEHKKKSRKSQREAKGKEAGLLTNFNEHLIGFYRHIQELGSRRIYAPEGMIPDSAMTHRATFLVILWSLLTAIGVQRDLI